MKSSVDSLKRGELRDGIIAVLNSHRVPLSIQNIVQALAEIQVHTTESSVAVTVSRMCSKGAIKRNNSDCCRECGRFVSVYYI